MSYSHIGYFRFEQKPGVTYDRPSFKPVEDAFGDRFKSASISGTTMTVEVYMKDKYYDSTRNEVYDALEAMKMNAYFDPTDNMVFETSGDKFVTHWHNGSGRMQECTNCKTERSGRDIAMYMYTQKPSNFFDEDKLKCRFWWLRDAMFRIDFTKLSDVDIEKTKRNMCDILEGSDFFESFERSSILFKEWEAKYATLDGDSDSDIEFYRIQNDIRDFEESRG
ncbi:hypothetical protein BFJ63_vAg8421 [Fusarium oxysporum f. sp. narcissi]|uniref:Uncharacterized protein n=1 Tax=Fusarium oxysporum f. sp. narcissi TaxID=451672 RepID=A0A4Q2VQ53_FUSOX|nr:hypothetical protein BFJ63_vAg8421 [Fusarium oxysporum f. sp. narcissi]